VYILHLIIPIHPVVLHCRSWKASPGQFVPPWSGAGLVHVRVLFSRPCIHDPCVGPVEWHVLQSDQELHEPLTAAVKYIIHIINMCYYIDKLVLNYRDSKANTFPSEIRVSVTSLFVLCGRSVPIQKLRHIEQ
jgi:hypothetical protein